MTGNDMLRCCLHGNRIIRTNLTHVKLLQVIEVTQNPLKENYNTQVVFTVSMTAFIFNYEISVTCMKVYMARDPITCDPI